MIIVIGLLGLIASATLILIGIVMDWQQPAASTAEVTKLRADLTAVQGQLAAIINTSPRSDVAPKSKETTNYTERDIRELLDQLDEASTLLEKRIFPITNAITTDTANWYNLIPNKGVQGSAAHLRDLKGKLKTEVWDQIDHAVYDPSNRHQAEMKMAFRLDMEAAKGELSRSLQIAIEALERLPENPSETTRDLVKPQFNEAYRQAEIVYQWWVEAKNRIASMKTNLKTKGVTGY
jgi:hypothetical protein